MTEGIGYTCLTDTYENSPLVDRLWSGLHLSDLTGRLGSLVRINASNLPNVAPSTDDQ